MQRFEGVISNQYLCDGAKPSIDSILKAFPNLKLYILDADRPYPIDNVTCVDSRRIVRYSFLGDELLKTFDFMVGDDLNRALQSTLWSRLAIGGMALGEQSIPIANTHLQKHGWYGAKKKKWLVISGCHRGGTTYITRTLTAVGVKVGHQNHGHDGVVSGALAGTNIIEGATVIHQIRHPVRAIESIQGVTHKIIPDALTCPLRGLKESRLLLAMKYWLWMHSFARLRSFWIYKLEEIEAAWPKICKRLDIDAEFPKLPANINARKYPVDPIEWGDLYETDEYIAEMIKTFATEYGYE